jgi:hypothetical protein
MGFLVDKVAFDMFFSRQLQLLPATRMLFWDDTISLFEAAVLHCYYIETKC